MRDHGSGQGGEFVFAPADEVCTLITKGTTPPKSEISSSGAIPFLRVNNLIGGGGISAQGDLIFVTRQAHEHFLARSRAFPGDTLMNIVGPPLGKLLKLDDTFREYNLNQAIVIFRPDTKKVDPDFLYYFVSSYTAQTWLEARSKKTSGQQNLTIELCKELPVPNIPLHQQRKIAEILRTWDEALEKLTALRAAKQKRLGALRYAMLFGELRLNDQRRNWAPTRLAAVTHELTGRNGAKGLGRDFVMGVTKAQGVVPMREQTIAGDISRYKRLAPRAFAYNPMRINVGSIAMNERGEEVLVSPDYVVFACNADGLDPDYLDHLRKTSWWAHYINSGGSGSVRQRTYYDDLAALKLPLPELDEQKAIAAVLNTARDDLAATEREIEAVTRQKRGLMQKLLTGEWRVNSEKELA
ncbi:restriction endonuclease subunit S [Rhodovulum sulfidophilum]|nr:restriction endonuclease subunit S [Rhodovulum sulfidophilum]